MFKKLLNGKIVIFLIMLSPLIDIITSIMLFNGIDLTLGLITKTIVLMFATLYLIFVDKNNKIVNYVIIGLLVLHNILHITNNIDIVKEYYFSYFGYMIKFDFMVIMLLFFMKYFKDNKFDIKILKVPIYIICLSLVLSNVTGTAFDTYDAVRKGTSAWFSSANELGAILSILYPVAIYLFLDRKHSKKIELIYVVILAYGLLEIGTKVGLISFYVASIAYIIMRLINRKKYKLNYAFYLIIVLIAVASCFFTKLPVVNNVIFKYEYNLKLLEMYSDEEAKKMAAATVITSNREKYLEFIRSNDYDTYDYIIGKSNIKYGDILLVELDMYDMFYMFGVFGSIIIYGTILMVIIQILLKYKNNLSAGLRYTKINMLVVALSLIFLISLSAGHVILCPSVSVYASLLCGYLFVYDKFEKEENNKKKILIGGVHAQLGGIERTLVNLLNMIDYDKYEVDLMLLLKNGDLLKKIPGDVRICTPYSEEFTNFFAIESYISKVVKHLLFNKYTSWLWTNNKKYDVAIDYAGYYLFTTYYIANSYSTKKYIWVHQNVYGSKKYDVNFERNFVRNIKKYDKYDNIVCVSDSSKDSFDKMFSKYKNKTIVINNILEDTVKIEKKIKLEGKYKIISVGRICPQKGFDRLVMVHKKLIDEGYDINTYLIGGGNDYHKIKDLVIENGVEDSLKLLGPKSNPYDYIKEGDLFVSTSHTEAYPTVLFESLICKTPWVGPDVYGVKDVYKVSPKNSCILTEDSIDGITNGVKDAINKKVSNKFNLNIKELNKKALNDFYKLIGG